MNKNSAGVVHLFLIFGIVLVGIVGIVYFAIKSGQIKLNSPQNSTQQPTSPSPTQLPDTSEWKTYRNDRLGFELKHPEFLVLTEKGVIELTHSITHTLPNPCNFTSVKYPDLEKLIDFHVEFDSSPVSLEKVIKSREPDIYNQYWKNGRLESSQGFIEPSNTSHLEGYKITQGIEGCGYSTYYFPVGSGTLIATRHQITPLIPVVTDYKKNLSLPGIIKPQEEERLFNQILSTFRFID